MIGALTRITATRPTTLGKTYRLESGALQKDTAGQLVEGRYSIEEFDGVQALGELGARQDSCHLSHAAKGCLFVLPIAMVTTDSRSGLSVTGPAGDQLRVWRDQRAGWRSRASTYNA